MNGRRFGDGQGCLSLPSLDTRADVRSRAARPHASWPKPSDTLVLGASFALFPRLSTPSVRTGGAAPSLEPLARASSGSFCSVNRPSGHDPSCFCPPFDSVGAPARKRRGIGQSRERCGCPPALEAPLDHSIGRLRACVPTRVRANRPRLRITSPVERSSGSACFVQCVSHPRMAHPLHLATLPLAARSDTLVTAP